jgi:hypothetical protein
MASPNSSGAIDSRPRTAILEYRIKGSSVTLHEIRRIALGSSADRFLDYFETSKRKRNVIDYTRFVATETEAEAILTEAKVFNAFVEQWINLENPSLAKSAPS